MVNPKKITTSAIPPLRRAATDQSIAALRLVALGQRLRGTGHLHGVRGADLQEKWLIYG